MNISKACDQALESLNNAEINGYPVWNEPLDTIVRDLMTYDAYFEHLERSVVFTAVTFALGRHNKNGE